MDCIKHIATEGANPTHGSGWIVQVQPTTNQTLTTLFFVFPRRAREKDD